jgi:perosamine synthetase
MISKLPIIFPAASLINIAAALCPAGKGRAREGFVRVMQESAASRRVYLTDSGITAFYCILAGLTTKTGRNEVILPAYTAGSLVVAVKKAGLRPVLCDVSLDDFNMDMGILPTLISSRTLAITCVHMFGIGIRGISEIKARFPEVILIEDCAQAMGAIVEGKKTGTRGDISFFSFNRGKNLPLLRGGCIALHNEAAAESIEKQTAHLPVARFGIAPACKAAAFYLATAPFIYGAVYPLISHFKETAPPDDIMPRGMGDYDVKLGMALAPRMDRIFSVRHAIGSAMVQGLQGIPGVRIPRIFAGDQPAFNRIPVMFDNPSRVSRAVKKLWEAGIESSRMYLQPLHHMFELGYAKDEFPKARQLAAGLLALPCHPGCSQHDIEKMITVLNT